MFRLLWLLVILSCSLAQASLQRDGLLISKALQTFTPDAGLRPGVITSPAGTFTYTFAGGDTRKTALSMPGGSASWEYDDAGWLSEAAFNVGQTARDFISYDRDISGLITNLHRLNGVTAQFGYDPLGQLTSARSFESGGALRKNENLGYLYDAAGNLAFRTNHTLLQSFSSGSFNQLLTATRSGSLTVAGSFGGQLSSLYVNTNRAELYSDATFATAQGLTLANGYNQFVTAGTNAAGALVLSTVTTNWLPVTVSFSYDLNGNLLSDGQKSYEYDRANQLTSVTLPGDWRTEYSYDGLGRRRISREYTWRGSWVLASEVRYVYDRMLVLQERRADNTALATYTRGLDLSGSMQGAGGIGGLLARTDGAGSIYYHSDGGGNITSLTDASGAVVARYLYDPFGKLLGRWGSMAEVNRYQFSSKETDRLTGLSYYGFRFYDPSLQRWLNQDPLGEAGGINLYGFVGNSPFSYVDPNGLFFKDAFAELGQGIYDLMMGDSPGQYDPNTYGRMRAEMLGGVDRDNNFLRDLFADTSGTIGDIATDQAASAAGGKLLVGAVCKLAKPIKNLATDLIGESPQLSKPLVQNFAAKPGVNAAEAAATTPNRIYSARELVRRAENPRFNSAPNPNHNFPESFNEQIFTGTRTVKNPNYVEYTSPGTLNGRTGTFEIGVRPSASGRTEVIVHRFFRPDP